MFIIIIGCKMNLLNLNFYIKYALTLTINAYDIFEVIV